jgi:hypothetical protein
LRRRIVSVADEEAHLDIGIFGHETRHEARREILRGRDDAKPQAATPHALDGVDFVDKYTETLLDGARRVDDRKPRRCGPHAGVGAVEQKQPRIVLQLLQLKRHRRRRDAQFAGCGDDPLVATHRSDRTKLLQRQIAHGQT